MKLEAFMNEHDLTDKSFGERIGKSRIQVYRYRHGMQIPTKNTMQKIVDVTQGAVDPASFYQSQDRPQ
jgi:transcriptional regulator with XRE-family HTH domain